MADQFTAEEWFTLLEPEVRDKAITATRAQHPNAEYIYQSLAAAIHNSFTWAKTPERHEFWFLVYVDAQLETRKPATNRGMIDCTIRKGE